MIKTFLLSLILLSSVLYADDIDNDFDEYFQDYRVEMKVTKINDKDRVRLNKMWKFCAKCHGQEAQKKAYGKSVVLANRTSQWLRNSLEKYFHEGASGCMEKVFSKKRQKKITPILADKIAVYISEFKDVNESNATSSVINACMYRRK